MEIVVSVMCAAYNHVNYIKDALDGFLMQECTYPYEIIVHDDASTDGTADIIREYAEKYPDRIQAILQTENQRSKGIGLAEAFYPKAKGKYIAMCEGDDYWTDPLKLQKQIDALEAHPEIDICATCAALSKNENIVGKCAPADEDTVFNADQVIRGGGEFVCTCSLVIRTDTYRLNPEFRQILPIDYSLQILGSLRGGMLYLSDCTGVYRTFVKGSWTVNFLQDREKRTAVNDKMSRMLVKLNEETDGKYADSIEFKLKEFKFQKYNNNGEFRKMLSPEFREIHKILPFFSKVKLVVRCIVPGLVLKCRQKRFTK